ncbi:molecular chaperone GrpE [Melghirimyces profundicolus]|uniref:Protein GrpE n=1 Tax=Melghirimyces profundicolus TaxID=1242148 RepID=A0A2T6C965_9BACL|nr:nucleotide exchange factor GrpE [Melghirimyces profundicolus]PTX64845.1 molecular chaperone GrpE [Melghirimyces profundicolus]
MTSNDFNQEGGERRPVTARELRKRKEALERQQKEQPEKERVDQEDKEALHNDPLPDEKAPSEPEKEVLPENPELVFQLLEEELEKVKGEAEEAKKETAKWKKEAEENEERALRSAADLENFRRRAKKEREELAKYAAVPLVEKLLPVLDNLERALEAGGKSEDAKALHQGVEMVYRQLLQSLEEHGLTPIEAEGLEFNPHEHNAVMEVEAEGVEPGMVVEELQKGYRFKDRVIRPSMVKVSS